LIVSFALGRADFRFLGVLLLDILLLDVLLRFGLGGLSLQFGNRGSVLRCEVRDRLARLIDDGGQLGANSPGVFLAVFVGVFGGQLIDAAVRLSRNFSEADRGLGIEVLGLGGGFTR